jgi:REP-associated tyrosine transposase
MIIKHPLPLSGFDYIGQHYYGLTWCCDYRKPLFTQSDRVDLVLQQFLRACAETKFELIAYNFMQDHAHKLVRGMSDDSDGRRYIKLAKQYSGYYFSQEFGEKLWQRYGVDQWLQDDLAARRFASYTIENPVKAGLVERVEDYPYTGSSVMSLKQLIEWSRG